jgi:hypothetical protein
VKIYSFQIKNKKTELEIGYHCINMSFLREAGDGVNFSGEMSQREYHFDILQSQLDEKLESGLYDNFVSHQETRLKIYEAYTQSNASVAQQPVVDTFATFKEILGDQYDDDFLSVVAALDWQKINALRQKDPTTLDAIKLLIEQIYVDYLIEKDFTPTGQKNVSNAGDLNSAAFVYPEDDYTKDFIISRLEHINKAYLDREIFPLQLNDEPFPKMNLTEFGQLFMDVVGEKTLPQPLIWHEDRASVNLYMNKSIEPAVNLSMYFHRYSGDGDVKLEFKGVRDFGYNFTKGIENTNAVAHWGNVNNYPQKYYAAYVMYWLSVYTLPANMGNVLFTSETKAKQVLPLKASQFALNELRYFNSLGLFPTPEVALDYIKEIAEKYGSIDVDYFGNDFRFIRMWFYSNTTSQVSDNTKFGNINIKRDQVRLFMFQNDAKLFIEQLKAIDVDWGNPNAVYEPVVITTTTPAPIKRTRQPKKPKLKFEEWKEPPSHFKELIEKAYDGIGQLWYCHFDYQGERYAFVNFVAVQEGNNILQRYTRTVMEEDSLTLFNLLDFTDDSEVLIHQFQDDFSQSEIKLYEKIKYPIGNIVFRLAMKIAAGVTTQGTTFVDTFKALLAARIDANKVVTPPTPPPAPPTPPPAPPTPPPAPPRPPAPPKPPKPKVVKPVTPAPVKQTKVEKLSQKYDDLDIDF